jgi:hypothetical protein
VYCRKKVVTIRGTSAGKSWVRMIRGVEMPTVRAASM